MEVIEQKNSENTVNDIRENTGTVKGRLRSMSLGKENKGFVPLIKAQSTRQLISQIHGEDGGLRFETEAGYKVVDGVKQPGIYVWRTT